MLCRITHRLCLQGVSFGLRYVESALNSADYVSKWGLGRGANGVVVDARAKAMAYTQWSGRVWGTVGDRDWCLCAWDRIPMGG